MRILVLTLLLTAAACGAADGSLDPAAAANADGGSDGGRRGDMHGCRTACDCDPGETCASGDCIMGLVAVYCCSDESCPPQEICQAPSGEVSLCGGLGAP
jgi:hypothetical protein